MESIARLIVLLLAIAIVLALVRGGWSGHGGVLEWLKLKFIGG